MIQPFQVGTSPARPCLIYDGDCTFCVLWVERWKQITGAAVEYLPFQSEEVRRRFAEIPETAFQQSVQLVAPDGTVYHGSEAVFRSLATVPHKRWPLWLYSKIPGVGPVSEAVYSFVAQHRQLASIVTRLGWGRNVEQPAYGFTRWLFLRVLAAIYFAAFVSLWVQIHGLIGEQGILPATETMQLVRAHTAEMGFGKYRLFPTLCWMSATDAALTWHCAAGAGIALVLLAGFAPALCLALLWVLYLSLATVSRDFLSFQWDNLLLEVGLLAIFLAPRQWLPRPSRESAPSRIFIWLLRWVLFRLMFESGLVKLASGDTAWRDLTALAYHYETQPLPTWIGWYAHQLPLWIQQGSAAIMFVIELALPFLILLPRRPRMLAAGGFFGLELLIAITGNYGYFNFLSIALCILLLDDAALSRLTPSRWRTRLAALFPRAPAATRTPAQRLRLGLSAAFALLVFLITAAQLATMWRPNVDSASGVWRLYGWVAPFRSINPYGLFAVMTKDRPEIEVEGSDDGRTWRVYGFRYKPGNLDWRPRFVAPHQPRLDWQMWFAALGTAQQNPWFTRFCGRLLEGSPEVLGLLRENPFPEKPPRFVRAIVYDYRFSTPAERAASGHWWRRELKGLYAGPFELKPSP